MLHNWRAASKCVSRSSTTCNSWSPDDQTCLTLFYICCTNTVGIAIEYNDIASHICISSSLMLYTKLSSTRVLLLELMFPCNRALWDAMTTSCTVLVIPNIMPKGYTIIQWGVWEPIVSNCSLRITTHISCLKNVTNLYPPEWFRKKVFVFVTSRYSIISNLIINKNSNCNGVYMRHNRHLI